MHKTRTSESGIVFWTVDKFITRVASKWSREIRTESWLVVLKFEVNGISEVDAKS